MKPLFALLSVGAVLILPHVWLTATPDPGLLPRFLLLALILLLSIAAGTALMIRRRNAIDFTILSRTIFLLLLGSIVVAALSLAGAINVSEGLFDWSRLALFVILIATASVLMSNVPESVSVISRIFVLAGITLALIGGAQYFRIAFDFWEGRPLPYGTMANKNLYASSLFLTIPFLGYRAAVSPGGWKRASSLGLILVAFIIVLCRTRAVWLALAVAVVSTALLLWILLIKRNMHMDELRPVLRSMRRAIALMAIGVLAGVGTIAFTDFSSTPDDADPMTVTDPRSIQERLVLWERSLRMISDHPVMGVGGGNWKIALPRYGMEGLRGETGNVFFQRPHNDFLWVLAEHGPLGLIFYLSIFLVALYYCWLALYRAPVGSEKFFCVQMIFGIIGFMVFSFFGFPRERVIHLSFIAMILASAIVVYHRSAPAVAPVKKPALMILTGVAGLCLIAGLGIGIIRLNSDIHTNRAVAAAQSENWKRVIREIDRAYHPLAGLDPTSTPPVWYKGYAQLSLHRIDEACSSFHKAISQNPNHVKVLDNLATCYELEGDHKAAIEYYRRALDILPGHEKTSLNLAAACYNAGRYEEAYAALLNIKGKPTDSRYEKFMDMIRRELIEKKTSDSGMQ